VTSRQFITHLTIVGERWDLLAWNYYGDPTQFGPIVMANPTILIEPVFEAGISILIPILEETSVTPADLPPWKQTTS